MKKEMTNQLVRASVKYRSSFIGELQQYLFFAPPPPPAINKKNRRHDQPLTSAFWFNSFIISCLELQRLCVTTPAPLPQRLIKNISVLLANYMYLFRSTFLQTSCCLVGPPGELYFQVLKKTINLTCMILCCMSK